VISDPDSESAQIFKQIAGRVAQEVAKKAATSLPVLEV
jgi:adenosyl cobinamide kinase/adenosyl cobinamide phosphate guanylyltransferase